MMTTKQVAENVGLSVRIIQEYEKAGLAFKPTHRNKRGYLLYDDREVNRLWQIRFYRELGYDNKQIHDIFDDPAFDFHSSITRQIEELKQKKLALDRLIETAEFIADSGITPLFLRELFASAFPFTYDYAQALLNNMGSKSQIAPSDENETSFFDSLWDSIEGLIERAVELAESGEPPESIQIQVLIEAIAARVTHSSTNARVIVQQVFSPGSSIAQEINESIGPGSASYFYNACMIYLNNHPIQEFEKRLETVVTKLTRARLRGCNPASDEILVLAIQFIQPFRQEPFLQDTPLRVLLQALINGYRDNAMHTTDESDDCAYIADALQHYMDITPADVLDQCGASPQTATESEGISDSSSQSSESELDRQLRLALQRLNPNPAFVDEAFKMEPTQRGRADLLAHLRSMDSQNNQSLKNNRKDGSP